jgi:hypothetical protein
MSADEVAEAGYRGLMGGRRVIVPGFLNKVITVLIRLFPRGLILRIAEARQARRRPARDT